MPEIIWTKEASMRVDMVPAGFMRNMTKKRVLEHAEKSGVTEINIEFVESVIDQSRAGMGSMMGGDQSNLSEMMKNAMGDKADAVLGMMGAKEEITEKYYFCFVCGYALKEIPGTCPLCNSPSEKFSEIKKEFLTRAHTIKDLVWSESAKDLLEEVPEGYQRNMTRWEVEGFCRKNDYCAVTADIFEERIEVWKQIAKNFQPKMEWDPAVLEKVKRIPETIRGMVMKEMENMSQGLQKVNQDVFEKIKNKWVETREFHTKWM